MPVELFLSYDEHLDWLILIEFGRVENAQPRDHWRVVSESFCYLLRHPEGPGVGSKILGFSGFDPEDPEVSQIWEGPRFDVPTPGLSNPTAGRRAGRSPLLRRAQHHQPRQPQPRDGAGGEEAETRPTHPELLVSLLDRSLRSRSGEGTPGGSSSGLAYVPDAPTASSPGSTGIG